MKALLLGAVVAAVGITVAVTLSDDHGGDQGQTSVVRVEMTSSASSNPDFATSETQVREHGGYFVSGSTEVPVGEVRLVLPSCRAGTVSHGYEVPNAPGGFEYHGLVRAGDSTSVLVVRNAAPLPVRISIGQYCRPKLRT